MDKRRYHSIRPGQVWLDTDGNRIQAHGGSVLYHEGTFYWYGENKENTVPGAGVWHNGVCCYSSQDLYNWKNEGIILKPVEDDPHHPLHPSRIMDRPHILYDEKRKRFVMWVKFAGTDEAPDDWHVQYMGIAVSDSILGPFELVKTIRPLGMSSGDFDLVKNESDGKAYFYFERVHTELICADLTEDYMDVTGYYSSHFPYIKPPAVREAPAFFQRDGVMYLITSGTTGYCPNQAELASSYLYHGPWTVLGDPCVGDEKHLTFNSQVSSVFRHPTKKDLYIAVADRWIVDYEDYHPAIYPKEVCTQIADYVWLPIRFGEQGPYLAWQDEWTVEEFD